MYETFSLTKVKINDRLSNPPPKEDAVVELPETDEELLQLVGSVSTDPATD